MGHNNIGSCYPPKLLSYAMEVINTFSKYPNTLAFVLANEVLPTPKRNGQAAV